MSSIGYRNIQLEIQRREELRLENFRKKTSSLLDSCRNQISSIKDPAVQQLVSSDLKKTLQEIKKVSETVKSRPDKALKQAKGIQSNLQKSLKRANQKASKLTKEQSEAKSELDIAQQCLEAEKQTANQASRAAIEDARLQINEAKQDYAAGRFEQALIHCREVHTVLEDADRKAFDETVRRETVKSLITTLGNMGFITENPVLVENDMPQNSKVRLTGTLPSGKKAAFLITLDGKMEFDFDGYQSRACAKEMEKIESTLAEQFSIKLGPAQVTWKNPDRISKGALNLPSSNSRKNL